MWLGLGLGLGLGLLAKRSRERIPLILVSLIGIWRTGPWWPCVRREYPGVWLITLSIAPPRFSPVQCTPSPEYPVWHVQENDPLAFVQFASAWQLWTRWVWSGPRSSREHSLMSEKQQPYLVTSGYVHRFHLNIHHWYRVTQDIKWYNPEGISNTVVPYRSYSGWDKSFPPFRTMTKMKSKVSIYAQGRCY